MNLNMKRPRKPKIKASKVTWDRYMKRMAEYKRVQKELEKRRNAD
jgi:hypothetical protein